MSFGASILPLFYEDRLPALDALLREYFVSVDDPTQLKSALLFKVPVDNWRCFEVVFPIKWSLLLGALIDFCL